MPATLWLWPATRALLTRDAVQCGATIGGIGLFPDLRPWMRAVLFAVRLQTAHIHLAGFSTLALALGVLLNDASACSVPARAIVVAIWIVATAARTSLLFRPMPASDRRCATKPMCARRAPIRRRPSCGFPRNCDSVGFYLERADLRSTRSKFVHLLVADLLTGRAPLCCSRTDIRWRHCDLHCHPICR